MRLCLIAAASENHVIGRGGQLPWRLSADLRRFKRLTMGHCLIMGRKTYESIGGPLPGRVSVVLTRRLNPSAGGGDGDRAEEPPGGGRVLHASSLDGALALLPASGMERRQTFVTGGGEVYRIALPRADRIHLTRVHTAIHDGDTFFPAIDRRVWTLTESAPQAADEKNEYGCTFEIWDRRPAAS